MDESLNVLMIEDSEDDALLLLRALRRGDFDLVWERVQTAESLRTLLTTQTWDVIISDYRLPGFDAPTALNIVKQSQLDIPFIVVSGTIGERLAVDMMKAGAHDYLMKENLTRLPEAVRREVRDAKIRAERKQAEILLRRQQAAIDAAIDGIGILQGDTYVYANQAHLDLFGFDCLEELVGQTWRVLYSKAEIERFEQTVLPMLERDRSWQGEAIATRKDGSTFAQGVSLTFTEDGLLICVCRDISDFKRVQEQIIHNALHDPLTNLPNRTLLTQRLELAISRARRLENHHYAVLFLDLDRFKVINDSLGHLVGDQLLTGIAQKLKTQLRDIDLVARLGGDEFVILLEEINGTESVIQIAERILSDCQTPFLIDGHEIFTSLSIGIVLGTPDYHQAADLIRDADIAMYQAKAHEHRSYIFFDATMYAQVLQRLTLETDLRKALVQEELIVYYQPVFNLLNHRLVGLEALVRWQHPTRGLISPCEFVPVAEETGLIVQLDNWVLHQACQQMVDWQTQFPQSCPLKISTNLSTQDLRQSSLIEEINHILARTGLDGDAIILEITESMLIENIDETIDILAQLSAKDIRISIDDFGTGYSSLKYLHRLPVNNLKIDRSFVGQMHIENRNYQVVSTIIALGNQLDLKVVAEGIETPQQLQQLQQLGCQLGQGYLFSPPLPAAAIEAQFLAMHAHQKAHSTFLRGSD
ncbi:MAG: EAL domain-containing protein [Cyanobacteria bacterium P01_G01_bin.38]